MIDANTPEASNPDGGKSLSNGLLGADGWNKFKYDEPITGIYWMVTQSPDVDVDVDDYGNTVGQIVGTKDPILRLVEIDYTPGEEPWVFRDIQDQRDLGFDDSILFWRELDKPVMPDIESA